MCVGTHGEVKRKRQTQAADCPQLLCTFLGGKIIYELLLFLSVLGILHALIESAIVLWLLMGHS